MKVSAIHSPAPLQVSPAATLERAMATMEDGELRHLPVVEDGRVIGVVSDRDLLEATGWVYFAAEPGPGEERRRVREVMRSPAITIEADTPISAAAHRMLEHGVGCLPIVSQGGELVGMLSELDVLGAYRDALRSGAIDPSEDVPVSAVASAQPVAIPADDGAELAMETLRANGFRHLPVVEGSRVVGIVSDRDLRRALGRQELDLLAVGECMTQRPLIAGPTMPLSTAVSLMVDACVSALPVVEDGELVAVLSVRDALEPCAWALDF